VVGIKNPAVDAMMEQVLFAESYADLVAAAKALDRILLWNHYVVPQWSYNKLRTVRWDRFDRPDPLPKYGISAFPTLWWWDPGKTAKATKHVMRLVASKPFAIGKRFIIAGALHNTKWQHS
jgi:microcin C transport system substrate-binding protein